MKQQDALRKTLLACGIVSSVLFVVVDIIASCSWETYRFTDQAFSELTAIEAPTRSLMVMAIGIPYNLLVIACSSGVWLSAAYSRNKRFLRFTAIFLLLHALSGFIGGTLFPMHSRGMAGAGTLTDTMHISFTAIEVLSLFLATGFGAACFGRTFRVYSIITIILLLAGGGIAAMYGGKVAANQPTPGMGIVERLNIYSFMLWATVLAIMLWRKKRDVPHKIGYNMPPIRLY